MSTTAAATTPTASPSRCRPVRSTCRWSRCRAISARRPRCSPASTMPGSAPCCSWMATASIRPNLIETLVARWLDDDYDVVYTAKAHRENEPWHTASACNWFYTLINWGSRQQIPEDAGDFRLLSPRAAAALRQMPERNRFFKGLSSWIGFRQMRVDYEPAPRAHGATSWNVWTLLGLSIEGLTSFSVAPLRVASLLGLLLAVDRAVVRHLRFWSRRLIYGQDVPGYPSLVVGMMVIGGVQLLMIGVLGEYIGKMLSEAKARPVYFVAEHSRERAPSSRQEPHARAGSIARGRMSVTPLVQRSGISGCAPTITAFRRRSMPRIRELIVRGRLNATSVMVRGAALRPRTTRARCKAQRRDKARRDRPARDADRAVQAAERELHAAARRPFPAAEEHDAAHGDGAGGSTGTARERNRRADASLCRRLRPTARFHRRPSARASVSAGARRLAQGVAEHGAQSLGAPMRPRRVRPRQLRDRKACCSTFSASVFAARRGGAASPPIRRSPAPMTSRRTRFRADLSALSRRPAGWRPGDVPSRLCRCRTRSGSITLTAQREREYAYFNGEEFPRLLRPQNDASSLA